MGKQSLFNFLTVNPISTKFDSISVAPATSIRPEIMKFEKQGDRWPPF
jgi:hypothetical protein